MPLKHVNKCFTLLVTEDMHTEAMFTYCFVCANQIGQHMNTQPYKGTLKLCLIIIFYKIGKIQKVR